MISHKYNSYTLPKIQRKNFVLLVGDDGAILNHIEGNQLKARLYASLNSQAELEKFKLLLSGNPNVPISILIDVIDQSYNFQILPAVSFFTINKLVKKKLNRDFAKTDIKAGIYINRTNVGRNDWNYLFASVPVVAPLSEWLNFVISMPNSFRGSYLLPLEMIMFVNIFNNPQTTIWKLPSFSKKKSEDEWNLLILHNKVSGLRQVALKNKKIIFTRLTNVSHDETAKLIAGTINQEIVNSFEYFKRLGLKEQNKLDIFIIVSKEVRNILNEMQIKAHSLIVKTPFEVAQKLQYKNVVSDEDKFADTLISTFFAFNKPICKFIPLMAKNIIFLEQLSLWIRRTSLAAIVIFSAFCSNILVTMYLNYMDTYKLTDTNKTKAIEYEQLKSNFGHIGETDKISELLKLYKFLTKNHISPFSIMNKLLKIKSNNILINSIEWRLDESKDLKYENVRNINLDNIILQNIKITTSLNIDFYNNQASYQILFSDFDDFIKSLKTNFSDYNIQYTKISDQINFESINKIIPVKLTIKGPK